MAASALQGLVQGGPSPQRASAMWTRLRSAQSVAAHDTKHRPELLDA
jgi:hypothetical protein